MYQHQTSISAIKQDSEFKFIRIYSDKKDFDNFRTINEIFRHNKQATKKL